MTEARDRAQHFLSLHDSLAKEGKPLLGLF